MGEDLAKRAEELREKIDEYDHHYYVRNDPIVSDKEYDELFAELERIEEAKPDLRTPDSPTQRVGDDLTDEFPAVEHDEPMLSLQNSYNRGELEDFDRRAREGLDGEEPEYVVEYKIDGTSISLRYENGKLASAATRGDGKRGDDVLANARVVRAVPLSFRAPKGYERVEIRGEIFMPLGSFEKLNRERERRGEKPFANPRNAAAGTLKLRDPKIAAARGLSIFVYQIVGAPEELGDHAAALRKLEEFRFNVTEDYRVCASVAEALDHVERLEARRDELDYEVDGAVIKVNDYRMRAKLGAVSRSPRWAISYKFAPKRATTKLERVVWQVGRTGAVTPVGELEPVSLAGSTVSRATLHNYDEITRKNVREGDRVTVEKGGDVIPKIVAPVESARNGSETEIRPPKTCPSCGGDLTRQKDEVGLYCVNAECPAQKKARLRHFASRGAMDVEGLGEAVVETFVEKGLLDNFADVYDLRERADEIEALEGFGEKSVGNLIEAIEASKRRPFERVLYALGVRFVGESAAQTLARTFGDVGALANATVDELQEAPDVGPRIATSVRTFFEDARNLALIERLKKAGLRFESEADKTPEPGENFFAGKKFVLTGSLERHSRTEAKKRIERLGGKVVSAVSGATDAVIAGADPGSKLDAAKKKNVAVVSEEEFYRKLKEADAE
jgi:DNA ligase (NAD+)